MLQREEMYVVVQIPKYAEHPNESMPKITEADSPGWWIYQDTFVDMESFGPVLDQAMELAGAARLQAVSR